MIKGQREKVYERIRSISNFHSVYPGLTCFQGKDKDGNIINKAAGAGAGTGAFIDIADIPGVKESGWKPPIKTRSASNNASSASSASSSSSAGRNPLTDLQAKLGAVLKAVKNVKDAWPFQDKVDAKLVPDYYTIIKEPMCFKTMDQRLNDYYYKTKEMFIYDFKLVVNNCRRYNQPMTTYYRCADVVDEHFEKLILVHLQDIPSAPK
jgi:histone acetyltransferase